MKVILLTDVPRVGRRYEVKELSPGYARNFIIKRKWGEIATPERITWAERERARNAGERALREDLLLRNFDRLAEGTLTIKEKANEHGHLFRGIGKDRIVSEIRAALRINIGEEHIDLPKPLKETGTHTIAISVHDRRATLSILVERAV